MLVLRSFNPPSKEKIASYIVIVQSVIIIWIENVPLTSGTCDSISNHHHHHPSGYKKLFKNFPIQNSVKKENVDEAPPLASKKSNTKAITVDSILTNSLEKRLSTMTVDEAKHADFDPVTYKTLFLAYLTANTLLLAHSDRPALTSLLAYVKNCESDELPIIDRLSMRTASTSYTEIW